ncbi:phosphotransferase [Microbacterium sp. P5_E9]
MHEGEVEVEVGDLSAALAAQFPEFAGLPVRRVESAGTVIAPFRVGENVVARLPLVPTDADAARDSIHREQRYALVLADHLRVAVPRPLGIGEPFRGYSGIWSVWTWLPGQSLDQLPLARDARLAGDLAEVITSIQALPAAGRMWNGEGRGGRPLADTSWVRESIDASAHLIDPREATVCWERALAADSHQGPAVRIHGDPMPGNFLANDGRLTGMVDVAQPTFGDPAADLQPAWVLFDEPARSVFLTSMGLDESASERGRGWAFEMAIGGAHYYEHTNAVFFEQAMRTLHRLLAE